MYPTKKLWEILEIIRNWKSCKQTSDKIWNKITRIETISSWSINEEKVWYFNLTNDEKKKYQINKWDILFSHINSVEHIWKIAIAKKDYLDLFHWMNLLLLRWNKKDILDEYLHIILQFYFKSWYWAKICNKAINQASLNQKNIVDIQIPLPPLPTQKLIVQKLDLAFENIDKNINITKENLKNLEELNKSVLEKVFSEWEYEMKKLWEISKTTSWWTPLRDKKEYWWWNIPWLKSWELNDNLKINSSEEFITEIWLKNSSAKIFKKWTLLIALYWATAWKLWILDFDSTTNQAVCSIQNLFNLFVEKYLFYFLLSRREQIIKDSFWWAQPNISKTYLDQIQIPLPPLQKQKEIVSYLDQVFEKNKQLKTKYELQLKELEELKQSLLKDAFEGRLVKE